MIPLFLTSMEKHTMTAPVIGYTVFLFTEAIKPFLLTYKKQ